jgi:hypothetical protein
MMPKSTWPMALLGLFLAATLIWAIPAFAQLKSGRLLKSHKQSLETGSGQDFGYSGTTNKSQDSQVNQFGWKSPGQVKNQGSPHNETFAPAKPNHQPQTQTPGGTTIP